ncbi:PAS domain S-box protein [bacterium]|nr:PAS domain S-box protein [bacterium]
MKNNYSVEILDLIPEGAAIVNPATYEIEYNNEAFLRIFGYTEDGLPTDDITKLLDENGLAFIVNQLRERESTVEECFSCIPFVNRAGQVIYLNIKLKRMELGEDVNYILLFEEITNEIMLEQELRRSGKKLETLLTAMPNMMIQVGKDGTLLNYKAEKPEFESYVGRNLKDIFPEDLTLVFMEKVTQALESGELQVYNTEMSVNGEQHYFSARIIPSGEEVVMVIVEDMTERREFEKQLLQIAKLKTITTLAGGIVHNFNGVLNSIMACGRLIAGTNISKQKVKKYAEEIVEVARRSSIFNRRLLSLNTEEIGIRRVLNLNQYIQEIVDLLTPICKKDITIETEMNSSPYLEADPVLLEQALINIMNNAFDAMPDGGTVTVETENAIVENINDGKPGMSAPEKFVSISIKDTGEGMSPEIMNRIFEPYFTTKGVRNGFGLGLAMADNIVKQHDGHIEVESIPGEGTLFRILLPAFIDKNSENENEPASTVRKS